MAQPWHNPDYEAEQRRRRSRAVLAVAVLVVFGAVIWQRLRREAPLALEVDPASAGVSAPVSWNEEPREPGNQDPARPEDRLVFADPDAADAEKNAGAGEDDTVPAVPSRNDATAPPAGEGFAVLKQRALELYRRNDLNGAREQAQAALALRRDQELVELLLRVRREIVVQRNYEGARTTNFTVLFDGYEHEVMRIKVLDMLKDAYAEIGKSLAHFPEEPITVILYTGKDFSDITRAPEWAGGMFGKVDGKIRLPLHGAEGQEKMLRRVLFHEYVHALLHSLAPGTPLWLHEGLAQYFSGDRAVHIDQWIPLPLLAEGFPRDARAAYVAYMVSLQAVSDLVDERGMPPLRRLLNELGAGKKMEEAFAAAYGEPFSRWARHWRPVSRAG